jgi:hypothetical protein
MKLSQAISYHADTYFDRWEPVAGVWQSKIARGSFQVFDRFISSRTFGLKKRNVVMPDESKFPDYAKVVRMHEDTNSIFIIESRSIDVRTAGPYSYTFQLRAIEGWADIIQINTTERASGSPGNPVRTLVDSVPIDVERIGVSNSYELSNIDYGEFLLTFPGYVNINTDMEIELGNTIYELREVFDSLLAVQALGLAKRKIA